MLRFRKIQFTRPFRVINASHLPDVHYATCDLVQIKVPHFLFQTQSGQITQFESAKFVFAEHTINFLLPDVTYHALSPGRYDLGSVGSRFAVMNRRDACQCYYFPGCCVKSSKITHYLAKSLMALGIFLDRLNVLFLVVFQCTITFIPSSSVIVHLIFPWISIFMMWCCIPVAGGVRTFLG